MRTQPAIDRFWVKVTVTPGGCWRWTASGTPAGYGVFYWDGRQGYAHRFSHEHFIGPIPAGFDVDHLCRNRRCVNPAHLQAVTRLVNLHRGMTIPAANAAKDRCPGGHRYDAKNTYFRSDGSRVCRACGADRARAKRALLREAG